MTNKKYQILIFDTFISYVEKLEKLNRVARNNKLYRKNF